jgi:O-acetyl-ADP-ribose deacetylase
METKVGDAAIQFIVGDITEIEAEVIVNAANSTLLGGGGVDGAIHRKGGPKILEECKRIRSTEWPDGLPTGRAVITTGGNLKAKHVIHTVGPIWRGGFYDEAKLLRAAYRNSLKLAVANGLKSVAFPSISTGAYGYPTEQAAVVAVVAVRDFLMKEDKVKRVSFILFSKKDYDIYTSAIKNLAVS